MGWKGFNFIPGWLKKGWENWTGQTANDIADKNFDLSSQQFEYEKNLQQQIFSREDNSIQRRVADLKKSGLSPVLAAGSGAGAGTPIRATAPQKSMEGANQSRQAISQMIEAAMRMPQISKTKAETANIKKQSDLISANIENVKANTNNTITKTVKGGLENQLLAKDFANKLQKERWNTEHWRTMANEAEQQAKSQTAVARAKAINAQIEAQYAKWLKADIEKEAAANGKHLSPPAIQLMMAKKILSIKNKEDQTFYLQMAIKGASSAKNIIK